MEKPVLQDNIYRRRLRYYGHIARGGSIENEIIEGTVEGRRKRGRPAVKWTDSVKGAATLVEVKRRTEDFGVTMLPQQPVWVNDDDDDDDEFLA